MAYPALAGFLSGYLHQDWDLEATDPIDLVREFASTGSLAAVTRVVAEIERLLASSTSDDELKAEVAAMGCYVDPGGSGMTMTEWLTRVKGVLVEVASRRAGRADD